MKPGRTKAGGVIEAGRVRREADAAREKELADKLAALLATAPKPAPPPAPKPEPVIEPEPEPPAPVIREPTPAERDRARGEQLRLAQVAADMTFDVMMTWEQIRREGEAVRSAYIPLGVPADEARRMVLEFTPTCGSKCEKCGYPMRYTTDWQAPRCPALHAEIEPTT